MGPKKPAAPDRRPGLQEGGATGMEEDSGADPELVRATEAASVQELRDMFKTIMLQQQARDVQREQEAARQESRWKTLQHQFSLLQREVHVRGTPDQETSASGSGALGTPQRQSSAMGHGPALPVESPRLSSQARVQIEREPRLQCLSETDDVDHYLVTFERVAVACQWPTTDWAVRLAPLLTGKARAAYVSMDQDDAMDYELLKEAILAKYDISRETYRLHFRGAEVREGESPKELYVRLRDLYHRWMQPQKHTKEEIAETIILEQFLRLLSPDLQVWIKERGPTSAAEAASLADVFVAARRKAQPWTYTQWRGGREPNRPHRQPPPTKRSSGESRPVGDRDGPPKPSPVFKSRSPVCYQCGQEGHIKPRCPNNPANQSNWCTVPSASPPRKPAALQRHTVMVNGQEVEALVDTGSMQSLVSANLIPVQHRDYSVMTRLRCVHGDERLYPTGRVYVQVLGQTYLLEVGVVDNLPHPMILGRDFPILLDLVSASLECNLAVTRAMAKEVEEEAPLSALPFFNVDIEAPLGKVRKSKRQRRQDKFQFNVTQGPEGPSPEPRELPLKIPGDMGAMQQQDPDIGPLCQQAQAEQHSGKEGETPGQRFVMNKGVLYKTGGAEARMVVPLKARKVVIELGHSIPWAGHLGKQKTISRVSRHFYWPNMAKDIAEFCRTCPECQKTAS